MELLIRATVIAAIAVLAFAASSNLFAESIHSAPVASAKETTVQRGPDSSVDRGIRHETDSVLDSKLGDSPVSGKQKAGGSPDDDSKGAGGAPLRAAAVTFLSLIALVAIARRGVSAAPEGAERHGGKIGATQALTRLVKQSSGKDAEHAKNSTR
jgi:hypothetical protein